MFLLVLYRFAPQETFLDCFEMTSKGRGRTIQTHLKPCAQAQTSEALAQDVEPSPGLDTDALKLELLTSLKEDIAGIIKKELQDVIGDALSPLKLELQSVKAQLASNNATVDAKLAKLTGTMGDIEEALTVNSDDMADMKTTIERLTTKVAVLESKCEDLESRSRRNNIRIIGLEEGPGSCTPAAVSALLKDAFSLAKEPLVDRSHRIFQPKFKHGDRPRAVVCRLHYHSDCVEILRRARELQRIKVGDKTLSVFPDYTQKVAQARAAFTEVKRLLRGIEGAKYGLFHPAQLRITFQGSEKKFTSAEEAMTYVKTLISG